jgi:hypothetical protein
MLYSEIFGKKPDFKRAIFSNERREISEVETSNPCVSAQSPNKEEQLPALPLLRTVRESFPSYGSSLY